MGNTDCKECGGFGCSTCQGDEWWDEYEIPAVYDYDPDDEEAWDYYDDPDEWEWRRWESLSRWERFRSQLMSGPRYCRSWLAVRWATLRWRLTRRRNVANDDYIPF